MSNIYRNVFSIILVFSLLVINPFTSYAATFQPLPFEDQVNGRNSHAYNPSTQLLTQKQREDFVTEITLYAVEASEKWGIPASAIIGMSILESGFGTTRTAHFANNLFGIKVWGGNPPNAWQLKGQPNEDFEPIPIIANYGTDRIVFDETRRRDNWYRKFPSYRESVNFLAGNLLLNQRYGFARDKYQERINNGWDGKEASKQFLFEIANAGYNHLGGVYYRQTVGTIMDQWNLYQYDKLPTSQVQDQFKEASPKTEQVNNVTSEDKRPSAQYPFIDISNSWAKSDIIKLANLKIINGFPDKTFRPSNSLTRGQAAIIMVNFLDLKPTNDSVSFMDVPQNHSAIDAITVIAQHKVMNGTSHQHFSPNTIITRAQMAQVLFNAGLYDKASSNKQSTFNDIQNDHWALQAIETMREEGIIRGHEDGTFQPNQPITRAQISTIIARIIEKNENNF
ncbi:hypothetical protein BKP35_13100 [Anaerobacillus arseniciselenatis]|uniref:SLH domain-containing protein n=1 Tax=Anaerobacillus arseniciselenatis TaxID=85682 RepID=A0A1S2LER8_9BACI|nr:S-layer homology domain-containing protein [Anaerobacillus arseniciselenatis]OIJ10814.1 hypothetical protein BKP35_13100 [Anaerobacillus arseniciselenatis]